MHGSFTTLLAAIVALGYILFRVLTTYFGNRKTAFARIFSVLDMYVKTVPEHTEAKAAVRLLKAAQLRVEYDVDSQNTQFQVLISAICAIGLAIGYDLTNFVLLQIASIGFSLFVLLALVLGVFGNRNSLKSNNFLLSASIPLISDIEDSKILFILAFRIRSYLAILFARSYDKVLRTCSALNRPVSSDTRRDAHILFSRALQAFKQNGWYDVVEELEATDYSLRIFEYISLQGINEQDLLKNTNNCRQRLLEHLHGPVQNF